VAEETPKRRIGDFIRERPGTALALLAGAGALVGAEWAVGAVVGVAAMALVARRTGPEQRAALLARGKWLLDRAEARFRRFASRNAPFDERGPRSPEPPLDGPRPA
jgi:hypothetical protein